MLSVNTSPQDSPLYRRHIMFLLATFAFGGAEKQAILLANYLQNTYHCRITLCGLLDGDEKEKLLALANDGIQVITLNWWFSNRVFPVQVLKLGQLLIRLRGMRADVILAYQLESSLALSILWHLADVRLAVWNQRATSETIPVAWRWLASRIPLYIANSKAAAQTVREQLGVPQNRVVVVNNGTDTAVSSVDREELLAGFGIPANAFVVCMVANLTRFKDHHTLLRAWRHLQDHQLQTPAYLLLAGYSGDSADQVLSWIEQYGLTSSVRVIGFQSNIPALYAAVDVGVLSSLSEGLPNAVIECMLAGRPFVGTDIDGIREAVGEDYPYLAPPQDVISLSNYLQQLMDSPKLCAEVGIRNRLYAMDHFEMATQFLRYSDVLKSFMK